MAQSSTAIRSVKRDTPFLWEGKDKRGKIVKGKSLAKDETGAARGTAPPGRGAEQGQETVRQGRRRQGQGRATSRYSAASSPRCSAAGIPLVQSFDIVGAGHEKPSMQKLILDIKADVEGGVVAARSAGQASAVLRRPVREPGGGRRTGRCAREPAGQGRHLQGKDRGAEEEGQEGALLSGRGAGRSP